MKRGILAAFLLAFGAASARAQFSANDGQVITGQAGVGNAAPLARLDVLAAPSDSYGLKVSSQNGAAMFSVNAAGQVAVGTQTPAGLLDVNGTGDTGNIALQLRSGNSSSTFSSAQIVFAYSTSTIYQHALITRAVSSRYVGNEMDFFLWHSTSQPSARGALEVLAVQAAQSASTGSVHVMPYGVPSYELVVSSPGTTGGGTVLAATVGPHSSRRLKTIVATLEQADQDKAYADVLSLKPARFRYKGKHPSTLARGLIYEDSPPAIRDERGKSISMEARVAELEMALQAAGRQIRDLETRIAAKEKEARR